MSHAFPVSSLHGIGPAMIKKLERLGIRTLHDLLFTMPREYEDLSHIVPIAKISLNKKVTVRGVVRDIRTHRSPRKNMELTEALIEDDSGSIKIIWFQQPFVARALERGAVCFFSGTLKTSYYGTAMQNPVYEKIIGDKSQLHTGRIVPRYDLTNGITQKHMRYFIKQALARCLPIDDVIPEPICTQYHLIDCSTALSNIHFPSTLTARDDAKRRLQFEELYILQLVLQQSRVNMQRVSAPSIPFDQPSTKMFVDALPFQLTNAQRKAAWEILQNLAQSHPMNRLLNGDVGSGKTVVAAIAMQGVVHAGWRVVMMAPTEILAEQHYASLAKFFVNTKTKIICYTSSTRREQLSHIADADIIIGTHALIQEHITFSNLGLVIIDEQHRFGVAQRHTLQQKTADEMVPHFLSLTATPIPRTLALTLYGDLDVSILNELPPGRKPVLTRIIDEEKRKRAESFIREHIQKGEQCFVICPLIDESDVLGVTAVTKEYERLTNVIFSEFRIAMLHGKMKSDEKNAIMQSMKTHSIDILVATSVVEVGVDIPNATLMIIEDGERFGLAQLHQFRGRVGRAKIQSYCFVFTNARNNQARERLQIFASHHDGFALAEEDLRLRGSGEIYGTAQSGIPTLLMATLHQYALIKEARDAARTTTEHHWDTSLLHKQITQYKLRIHME